MLPIVLYNGRRRWTAPTDLAELIEPGPTGLDAYRPRLRYLLVDESAYADAELAAMRNLAAALFRLENSRGPETVREVLAALSAWLARLHAAAGEAGVLRKAAVFDAGGVGGDRGGVQDREPPPR